MLYMILYSMNNYDVGTEALPTPMITLLLLPIGLFPFGVVYLKTVIFAETVNTCKNRFDKFWSDQDVL